MVEEVHRAIDLQSPQEAKWLGWFYLREIGRGLDLEQRLRSPPMVAQTYSSAVRFRDINPPRAKGLSGYGFSVVCRRFWRRYCDNRFGGGVCLRADGAVRQGHESGRCAGRAEGSGARRAGSARAGDPGSAELAQESAVTAPLRSEPGVPI